MDGVRDVVLRVIVASGEGGTHLQILKRLSSPPDILLSNNHILPILYEITFQDIVILAVPKLILDLSEVISPRFSNSVEDMLYMVLQAFEVGILTFIRRIIDVQLTREQHIFIETVLDIG